MFIPYFVNPFICLWTLSVDSVDSFIEFLKMCPNITIPFLKISNSLNLSNYQFSNSQLHHKCHKCFFFFPQLSLYLEIEFEQKFLTFKLICCLSYAESGPEFLPPGALPNDLDNAGVQGSPVMESYGQGSPEANSLVSPSGEGLSPHPVSCSTLLCRGKAVARSFQGAHLKEYPSTGLHSGPEGEWSVFGDWGTWWGSDCSPAGRRTDPPTAGNRWTLAIPAWTVLR